MPQYEVTIGVKAIVRGVVVLATNEDEAYTLASEQIHRSDAYDLEIENIVVSEPIEAVEI